MRVLRFLLILVVLLVLVAAVLAWTAPAALAYRLMANRLGPVSMQGVSGSVWDGGARNVVALGVALGPGKWRIARTPALMRRELVGDFSIDGTAVRGRASIEQRDGRILLHDVDVTFPAALLSPALDIPALLFTGEVKVVAPRAELVDGLLASADGEATWRDIGIAGAAQARLPGIRVTFTPAAGGVDARIVDLGGALAVDGTLAARDGTFLLEATLALREDNPQLAELLQYVGQRRPDGSSYLRVEGTMLPLQ